MIRYWYYVYEAVKGSRTFICSQMMTTENEDFDLVYGIEETKRIGGFDSVIILNWKEISQDQYEKWVKRFSRIE